VRYRSAKVGDSWRGIGPRAVAVALASGHAARLVTTGLVLILVSRVYAGSDLAPYFLASTALATLSAVGIWGTDTHAVLWLNDQSRTSQGVIGSAIVTRWVVTALGLGPVLVMLHLSFNGRPGFAGWAMAIAVAAFVQCLEAIDLRRISSSDPWPMKIRRSTLIVGTAAKLFLAIALGLPLQTLFAVSVIESLLATVLVFHRERNLGVPTVCRETVRRYLSQGAPLTMAFLAYFVYARFDQFILGRYGTDASVASYSIATTIFEIGVVLIVSISQASMPKLSAAFTRDESEFWTISRSLTERALSLVAPIAIALCAGALLAPVALGNRYQSVPVLTVLQVPALLFVAVASVRSTYFVLADRRRDLFVSVVVSAAFSLSLNFWLVPRFDARAAAGVCALANFVSLMLSNLLSQPGRRLLKFQVSILRSMKWVDPTPTASQLFKLRTST
jgi:hypothetical protein